MTGAAVRDLFAAQNADGGWGAHARRASSTESTALVTLALGRVDLPSARTAAERGVTWLADHQRDDGGWPLSTRVPDASWSTALAVLALDALGQAPVSAVRGARWLLRRTPRTPGITASLVQRLVPSVRVVQQDSALKGWAWTAAASSFVEPTCHALFALKRLRRRLPGTTVITRIDEAERMIYDRMCREGGWNYGNARVLETDLWPYADATALALIALADHREREANQLSLRALHRLLEHVDSGLTLAWATLCFATYGEDVPAWRRRLAERYARSGFLGETKTIALAILASSGGEMVFRP